MIGMGLLTLKRHLNLLKMRKVLSHRAFELNRPRREHSAIFTDPREPPVAMLLYFAAGASGFRAREKSRTQ